jgi:ribosome-binding factor A
MTVRHERIVELLRHLAAQFLSRESDRSSLITVTRATLSSDLSRATIFVSVLPAEGEDRAIGFMKRRRTDFREFVKANCDLKRVPTLDFDIDRGEKNRQDIDEKLRLG